MNKEEFLSRLRKAEDGGDIHTAIALKNEMIEATKALRKTAPKVLSKSDEMECLRWAERAVGLLVRRGQQGPDKWISTHGDGRKAHLYQPSVQFFVTVQEQGTAFLFADKAKDDATFQLALDVAITKGSYARNNVAAALEEITGSKLASHWTRNGEREARRPDHLRGTRRPNVERVITQSMNTLHGVFMGLEVLEAADYKIIDPDDARTWDDELADLIGEIRKLRRKINGR